MAQYSRATLTDAGVVIARRMMDDDSLHLTFTGIASGDGQYSTGEDLAAKTALKSQKQFFPLSSKKVTSDQVVQLKYVLSNINPDSTPLTVGYYVREVGIFAQVGSEAAVLYAIAVADENTADYLPEYNELQPSTITMDWFLTVANTENISIAASTTAYALASDLAETNDEVATKLTAQGGDASGTIITTVTASTAEYPVPAAGDSMSTIVGKIVKFFGDIVKTFTGATSSAAGKKGLVPAPSAGQQTAYMRGDGSWAQPQNNATTTQNGYVLDAKMGKTLQDQITSLNDSLDGRFYQAISLSTDQYTFTAGAATRLRFRGVDIKETESTAHYYIVFLKWNTGNRSLLAIIRMNNTDFSCDYVYNTTGITMGATGARYLICNATVDGIARGLVIRYN